MCGRPLAKNPVLDSVEQCGHLHLHQSVKGDGLITSIGLRLPEQEKAMLAVIADRNETTISDIVRKLIRDYLGSKASHQKENEL